MARQPFAKRATPVEYAMMGALGWPSICPRLLLLTAVLLAGCHSEEEAQRSAAVPSPTRTGPATARWQIVDLLREDLATPRHPSDGGGRAWLEADAQTPAVATVHTPGRWVIGYEAGPLGIAVSGVLFLQVSPFWGWSPPQVADPDAPGYTEVSTTAEGVELRPRVLDEYLLGIEIAGRSLAQGEQVRIVYGAGPAGAVADRFAERNSRFWIAVDGDGDGVRKFIDDSPSVDVAAGPPEALYLSVPTTARPGQPVRLTVAVLDGLGNAGTSVQGTVELQDVPAVVEVAPRIELGAEQHGRTSVTLIARSEGVYRLRATGPHGLVGESNPLVVSSGPRILWGDLHGHSNFSDGTGTPEDYFLYARDAAGLDVAALTDHDHWGVPFLDEHPQMWAEIQRQTQRFHAPGQFVTLLGFEWTNWIYGHRHILYFEDQGQILSSIQPDFETPAQLWAALRGRKVLTFAHHSAGGPIATDWSIAPDPVLEPVTEIVSVHGSSEASDSPRLIYSAVAGNFVRNALDRGYHLGFIGSGDSHDGHPGLVQLAGPCGGLAAIMSEDLTRDGVLAAMRARRVYASNGPRIWLQVTLDGQQMGSTINTASTPPADGNTRVLRVRAIAPRPIYSVELIRSGEIVERIAADSPDIDVERRLTDLRPGEYLYARVLQNDDGAAWSSPFFFQ